MMMMMMISMTMRSQVGGRWISLRLSNLFWLFLLLHPWSVNAFSSPTISTTTIRNTKSMIRSSSLWSRNFQKVQMKNLPSSFLLPPRRQTFVGIVMRGVGKEQEMDNDSLSDVGNNDSNENERIKSLLLELISQTPSNQPTTPTLTKDILQVVRTLEETCPTADDQVLSKLAGNWELLWTAQDQKNDEWGLGPLRTWINPLENQSYSNNPSADQGRANPVLPRPIQDRLEKLGFISQDAEPIRSSQAIDLNKKQVRNVVSFTLPSLGPTRKASLTVSVDFQPNPIDKRKVDVKFQACKVVVTRSFINFNLPLGVLGPTGWLRTGYIDDTMRITRGHKGSIFILTRPGR